jgi:hypothetical protein
MAEADAHFVDCAINPDNPSSGSNLAYPTGLTHLEGETVAVLGDGAYLGTEAVSGGAIALDDDSTTNHVGLAFTSTVKPMKLNVEQLGIAATKKIAKAIVSFYQTLGGQVGRNSSNMETVTFRTTDDTMDASPDLFDGIKEISFPGGYEREGDIIITQTQPLPMIVRGAILVLGVNE